MKIRCHPTAVILCILTLCTPCGTLFAQAAASTVVQSQADEAPASQPEPVTLVKGPYLQAMRTDGLVLCLEPSQNVAGRIVVQDTSGKKVAEKSFQAATGKITRVAIDGLKAGESYQYAVYLADGTKPAFSSTFKAFPPAGQLPVEFAAMGDSRTNPGVFRSVCEAIRKTGLSMVLHDGDFVAAGRVVSLWNGQFFQPGREMLAGVTMFPAVGNHELGGAGPDGYTVFSRFFVMPENQTWYSFDYGGVHITVLDSTRKADENSAQYKWAEADLMASKAVWKIALFHHPWFNAGSHGSEVPMRQVYGPLFVRAGVDVILAGHDHNYQKTKPIVQLFEPTSRKPLWQIVTGGGGAPLYPVTRPEVFLDKSAPVNHYLKITADKERLVAAAYALDGREIDRLEIRKDAPVEGAVSIEQIELETLLRDWLSKRPLVFAPGAAIGTRSMSWNNTLPVPVKLRFASGDAKRFELASEPATVEVPGQVDGKPGRTPFRLVLRCLDPSINMNDLSIRMDASYEAGKAGAGKVEDIRVPVVAVKALQAVQAGEVNVDGKADEPAWSQAQPVTGFRETRKQEPEPYGIATNVRAARDSRNLYLVVTCKLPEGWEDADAEEITKADNVQIDLAGEPGKVVTLIATPKGKTRLEPKDGSARIAVVRSEGGWTLEAAVPLSQLGGTGEIRFNVQRQTSGKVFSLMPYASPFNYDTAAVIPMKAPAAQPATTR